MSNLKVTIEHIKKQNLYGLWLKSNDKTISKDIETLSKEYCYISSLQEERILPFFVLSKNYDIKSKDFELFVGSVTSKVGLKNYVLYDSEYARITIKPKFGFIWGAAIGEAKQYFYNKWLPASSYEALNLEYEYHTERSIGKQPTIDLIFAIKRKTNESQKTMEELN